MLRNLSTPRINPNLINRGLLDHRADDCDESGELDDKLLTRGHHSFEHKPGLFVHDLPSRFTRSFPDESFDR
jgi:hypothetical protein